MIWIERHEHIIHHRVAAVICQRKVMRDSFVWNVLICSAPCITVDICLMWGLSLHLGCTLCPSLISRCLGRGAVYIFLGRCRSEVRRCTLHRRGRRISTVNHHGCGGTSSCLYAPMLPPVFRATWCRRATYRPWEFCGARHDREGIAQCLCLLPQSRDTFFYFLTDKAPRQASGARMKRRNWIGGERLTWGLILRGFPLGDGGVLANEMTCSPKF